MAPMSSSVLASDIKSQIESIPGISIQDSTGLDQFCQALASAVVSHITANALVTIGTAVATGVTPGGASVPVTGTGTIT